MIHAHEMSPFYKVTMQKKKQQKTVVHKNNNKQRHNYGQMK